MRHITTGTGGYDEDYTWGRPPATYLTPRQVARLLILRSRLDLDSNGHLACLAGRTAEPSSRQPSRGQ